MRTDLTYRETRDLLVELENRLTARVTLATIAMPYTDANGEKTGDILIERLMADNGYLTFCADAGSQHEEYSEKYREYTKEDGLDWMCRAREQAKNGEACFVVEEDALFHYLPEAVVYLDRTLANLTYFNKENKQHEYARLCNENGNILLTCGTFGNDEETTQVLNEKEAYDWLKMNYADDERRKTLGLYKGNRCNVRFDVYPAGTALLAKVEFASSLKEGGKTKHNRDDLEH